MMNCKEHPHLTMAMAMRLGVRLNFGNNQTENQKADVVIKLTRSIASSGVGVGFVGVYGGDLEACGSPREDGSRKRARKVGDGRLGIEEAETEVVVGDGGLGVEEAQMEVVEGDGGSGPEEKEMEVVETLHLHSMVLRRSEFFEAHLSERWRTCSETSCVSSGGIGVGVGEGDGGTSNPGVLQLTLNNCKDPETFVRCIRFLYVPHTVQHKCFTNVEDALSILEVATKLVFHDCVKACMRYLESLPWSHDEESAIRACVLKLQLQLSDDLAARLCLLESVPDGRPVDIMRSVLEEILTVVTSGNEGKVDKAESIMQSLLFANVQPVSSSPAFALVNEKALVKEFSANLGILKVQLHNFANCLLWDERQVNAACRALRWILAELLKLEIADDLVRIFSEDKELAELMVSKTDKNPFTSTLFVTLLRILQALQGGDISSLPSVRLALLTTWLPVIAKLGYHDENFAHNEERQYLEEGLGAVVKTLPIIDQKLIFKIWIKECLKGRRAWPDLSDSFESWCSQLRNSHTE